MAKELRYIPIATDKAYQALMNSPDFLKQVEHYQNRFNDPERQELAEQRRDKKDPKIIRQQLIDFNVEILFEDTQYVEPKKQGVDGDFIKEQLLLPKQGKLISKFSREIAQILKDKNTLFFRRDSNSIVEIQSNDEDEMISTGFMNMVSRRFITLAELYFIPGHDVWDDTRKVFDFHEKSMSSELAGTILESRILQEALPKINRIFTVPIPIIYNGELTFPRRGYDSRFKSWLATDAPEIVKPEMPLEEAKEIIDNLFKEFCFQDEQDKTNALASLLTPFLRGLFPRFTVRTPVTFYLANRERAGKDYLAGITGIVYEGMAIEEPPISNSENAKSNNTDELRKKILAAMISGKKRMHFANNKGYIDNAVFEAITTAEVYSDRKLGKSQELKFGNEMDYSLSGNVGVGFTPDFANRCRFVRLFLDIEDANSREFNNPDLHNFVKENRPEILSALYSLVRNWIDKGKPIGSVLFTSFPVWAAICGGVMESAGYGNPCTPDKETLALGGDTETSDMKELFEVCYKAFPEQWKTKQEVRSFICGGESEIFTHLDLRGENRSDLTKFGNKLTKFIGRVLSDIRMVVDDASVRAPRQKIQFVKITRENKE